LVFDRAGNLYGTTGEGGSSCYQGTVFKLAPNGDGTWSESVLYSFCSVENCRDGAVPYAGLVVDQAGNLYGTTLYSGPGETGYGVVFKLTPKKDGSWTETVLHNFTGGKDGGIPQAGLVRDHAGNLYGTAVYGGNVGQCGGTGCGVVFRLSAGQGGTWTEKVLHEFGGGDGSYPLAPLVLDRSGSLYGTTFRGGELRLCGGNGCGVVFKLSLDPSGRWSQTLLHRFLDHPGALATAGLIFGAGGNLYGTSEGDFETTFGSVFEITP
jgi:uncharacterized repeat protein (TIGR03803 family)